MAKPSRPSDPRNSNSQLRTFFVSTSKAERRPILQTHRMATLLIDVIRSYTLAEKFKVHEFVVMRNHVHLLITIDGAMTIEKAMQLLKGNFSFRAKKELGFRGEVWQRGFSDVRVTDEKSFCDHQQYIYDNPLKAGMASSPEEYLYCSAYLRKLKCTAAKAAKNVSGGRPD